MSPRLRFLLLCVAFAFGPALFAQPAFFGEPLPITNTRYGTTPVRQGKLVTDGRDFFLFWEHDGIYMTRLTEGEPRVGIWLAGSRQYDVAWTGNGFLVAYVDDQLIKTQRFDVEGRPLTKPVPIMLGSHPRLAFNGTRALLQGSTADHTGAYRSVSVLLYANGVAITTGTSPRHPHAVASDGKGFAAVSMMTRSVGSEVWIRLFDDRGLPVVEHLLGESDSVQETQAIAGSPAGYLVAQCGIQGRCDATLIDEAGRKSDPLILDPSASQIVSGSVQATWNGEGWTVAYGTRNSDVIVHIDAEARTILSREISGEYSVQSLAAIGTRVKAALVRESSEPLWTADLPLEGNRVRAATHVAAQQGLLATATSKDATLFVWSELLNGRWTLWTGVRRSSGLWIEREITPRDLDPFPAFSAVAASDGDGFAVAFTDRITPRVVRIDSYGWRRWTRPLPFFPNSMAWNGSVFGLAALTVVKSATPEGYTAVAELVSVSSQGRISERVVIPFSLGQDYALLASDGYGFLLLVSAGPCFFEECFRPTTAMRLGPDLQRSDDVTIGFPKAAASSSLSVIWDGRDYLVTWAGRELVRIPRVARPDRVGDPHGIAFPIPTGDGFAAILHSQHAGLFSPGGALRSTFLIPDEARGKYPRLLQLPDGRIALVYLSPENTAPYYGRSRIMMVISDALPPVKPDSPSIGVTETAGGGFIVHWTPPPQPVTGYRLEYRAGDAPWKETEHSFPADARWTTFEPMDAGETYTFRIRAWNDAGLSAYSNEVRSSSSTARSSID